ncbi:MAG: hypothetical protein ABH950_01865, partial [Candidatus Altiarchaeota archaeon]
GDEETEKKRSAVTLTQTKGGSKKVHTKLDLMLSIINKRGVVKMTTLIKELNSTESQIEGWGRILENGGLVVVNIPLMGDPEFKKV